MTRDEFLERALRHCDAHSNYRLGGGKIVPSGSDCLDELQSSDCSSFVCWCAKLKKYQADELWWLKELNGGWLNTDGMYADSREETGNFSKALEYPTKGAVVVYPGGRMRGNTYPKYGHVGIITEVTDEEHFRVVHCSSGNQRSAGQAILQTDGDLFLKRKAVYLMPSSVKP